MEPLIKRASIISSGQQTSVIDDLPDDIVYNILKFFTIKDIARFSAVSRRCRNLCFSVPRLNIDLTGSQISLAERNRMLQFIDRFMIHRNGIKLESLKLQWGDFQPNYDLNYPPAEDYRVESWLYQAARCNVERLSLLISFQQSKYNKSFALPICFTNSLVYLKIQVSNGLLKLPTTGFSFVQELLIIHAELQQDLLENMLPSCKSLKRLTLFNLKGIESFKITSTCLEELYIIAIRADKDPYTSTLSTINVSAIKLHCLRVYWTSSQNKKLNVSAPNIIHLTIEGDTDCDYQLCSFNSLQKASIFGQTNPLLLIKNAASIAARARRSYQEILQHVRHTNLLHLNMSFVKHFSEEISATSFQDVHTLLVSLDSDCYDVPIIVSSLISFPNLQHLIFKSYFEPAAPVNNAKHLKNSIKELYAPSYSGELLDSRSPNLVDKLKLVEIDLRGSQSHTTLDLIKYLLKQAKILSIMTIYYPPQEYILLSKIIRSIRALGKASSTAAVYVLPRVRQLIPKHKPWLYAKI